MKKKEGLKGDGEYLYFFKGAKLADFWANI